MIIGYNHECLMFGHKHKKWVFFGPRPACPECQEKLKEFDAKMRRAIDRATPPAKGSPFYIDRDNRDRRRQLDVAAQSSVAEPYPILTDRYSFSQPAVEASAPSFTYGGGGNHLGGGKGSCFGGGAGSTLGEPSSGYSPFNSSGSSDSFSSSCSLD